MATPKVLIPLVSRNHLAVTADTTLNRNQCGDCLIHNTGASGTVVVTLPEAAAKLKTRFLRVAAQTLTIDPNGTDIIKGRDGVSLGAGVAKSLTADGAYLELECDGVAWNVVAEHPAPESGLADDAVTTDKIADDAVTAAKVADGAIDAAAKLAGGVVTPPKMAFAGIKAGHFIARNGAGAITLTGAAVGDRVIAGWKSGDASDHNTAGEGAVTVLSAFVALFEAAITVVDQIQQTSVSDLSDDKYTVLLAPAAA